MIKKRLLLLGIAAIFILALIPVGQIAYEAAFHKSSGSDRSVAAEDETEGELATFAGGCFWCMEKPFDELEGVLDVYVGYTGGSEAYPSYEDVASGRTDHVEAVQIRYDPSLVTYETILSVFWRQIDPTDDGGQFVDRGYQYSTAVFYHDEHQKAAAEESIAALDEENRFDSPIVTPVRSADVFYLAEDYHQKFYQENPVRYRMYRSSSGRDDFLDQVWGEERYDIPESQSVGEYEELYGVAYTDEELREMLTPIEYEVTQEDGTEPAYRNQYWDHYEDGIYVDRISGEPLFSSRDQYDSKTGWPSFTQPIDPHFLTEEEDNTLFYTRTEIRSRYGDSHLGHVFEDGPEPTGLRYCMNSAAMTFIPLDEMEEQGYGDYVDEVTS